MDTQVAGRLEQRPLELLEREIGELAAHIHGATCRWLELIAEFDRSTCASLDAFRRCRSHGPHSAGAS